MKFDDINFDEKLADGSARYRLLASGAVQDRSNYRIVARRITSEEGSAMARKRWDKWRDAAASQVLKEVQSIDPNIKTEHEAWAFLVGKQYITFLDAEKPRGDDLVKFGQVLGAMPTIADIKRESQEGQPPAVQVSIEGLRMLADILARSSARDVVDGNIVTGDDGLPKKVTE